MSRTRRACVSPSAAEITGIWLVEVSSHDLRDESKYSYFLGCIDQANENLGTLSYEYGVEVHRRTQSFSDLLYGTYLLIGLINAT